MRPASVCQPYAANAAMGDGMSVTRLIFTLLLAVALWVIAALLAWLVIWGL